MESIFINGLISLFLPMLCIAAAQNQLKCLVCRQIVNEITSTIAKEDPRKTIQVGSYRIQPDGSQKQANVKYAGSEVHLGEILETVCKAMEDYAQAKNKATGKATLLNLSKDIEKLSSHELVPDPDLNRSLKYYCESFIEDYEDDIMRVMKRSETEKSDPVDELCQLSAGYCTSSIHSEL